MAKQYLLLASMLLIMAMGFGQEFSRHDADSMVKALNKTKPGVGRIDLLLNLAQYHILKPGEAQIDFDSAIAYIKEASVVNNNDKSSPGYGYQLLTESFLAREKGQKEESKKMIEKAISILESGNNKYYLGRAYYELSNCYDYYDSVQRSNRITLVQQSISAFQQAGDLKEKGRSLEMLGNLYTVTGDFSKAIPKYKEALAAYDSIKYPNLQGVYVLLGESYLGDGDYGQSLFYLLKALKIAQIQNINSSQACQIYNNLGVLYHNIGRCDEEVKYMTDGLDVARKIKDDDATRLLATNISSAYCDLEQPDKSLKVLNSIPENLRVSANPFYKALIDLIYLKTYIQLQQLRIAKLYYDTLLSVVNNNLMTDQIRSSIFRTAATYLFSNKQYVKAGYYLHKSSDIVTRINYERGRIQDLRLFYMLDSAQGNFRSAFNYLLSYKKKMDSVNSERKTRQFQVMAVEYEVEMKEDSIKLKDQDILLLTQKNNLQQVNLKQASLIKNITIAGIILVLVILGLLYRQYRHKQKNNQVITQKNEQLQHYLNEKEWLLKEVHHRVKNNLQTVVSLLELQSENLKNEALSAILDSQNRIHAMSLIHQKLYQSENVVSINMLSYLSDLTQHLHEVYQVERTINFNYHIIPVELDVSQAIPIGLIVNEAVTNSFKHAFTDHNSNPEISISLQQNSAGEIELIMADNGIGLPPDFENMSFSGLGFRLMKGLVEDINGQFTIASGHGTIIKVKFNAHSPLLYDINNKIQEHKNILG